MAKLSQENVTQLGDAAVAANLASDVCIVAVVNGENANDKIAAYAASESYFYFSVVAKCRCKSILRMFF